MEPVPLFVYGTLRPGQPLYWEVMPFVDRSSPAAVENSQLYSLGKFPGLVRDFMAEKPVIGDLFYLKEESQEECLARLDRIEGEGYLFDRVILRVEDLAAETTVLSWVYVLCEDIIVPLENRILSNDWLGVEAQNADFRRENR